MYRLRIASRILTLTGLVLLAGCASTPPWPEPESEAGKPVLPNRVLLDDVPFYAQEKYQCGPASLAMMLNSQGLETDPDVLKELVYIPAREGSLQVEMVAGARSHNMVVYPLKPKLEAVLEEVSAGNPVLVMQNLLIDWWPQWHFAVVVGFDSDDETIILNTDTRKHHAMPYKAFHATWSRAERWAVVVLPPEQIPATAEPLTFLRAAHDLESTGHTRAALSAYQTAEQTWPQQPAPIMAQGNLAYGQQQWSGAVVHFRRVVEQFPDYAEGWNNLAYTLDQADCPEQATAALSCARSLSPERFGKEEAAFGTGQTGDGENCPALPSCPVSTQ
ncbi:PA2778 family cysteine peptidase [Marinobacter szutsaonensis]